MKKVLVLALWLCTFSCFAQYVVTGGQGSPLLVGENSYGTKKFQVYLLYGLNASSISFDGPGSHQWFRYKTNNSAPETVSFSQSGSRSEITNLDSDYAYYVKTDDIIEGYIWIADYTQYPVSFQSLEPIESDDKCQNLKLLAGMSAPEIKYFLPNGSQVAVTRKYTLTYQTQQWNKDLPGYQVIDVTKPLSGFVREISIDAPLQDTKFTLSDDFSSHFGINNKIESLEYKAIAVSAQKDYKKQEREIPNENNPAPTEGDLGGSAPIDITFTAYANKPVATFFVWKIYKAADGPDNPIVRYTDETLHYVFEGSGKYIAQLEVTDRTSTCIDTSQTYTITVYESFIDVPNVFSPTTSPGVNDEFKVAYKSISKFSCTILNRWGNQLYKWNDPAMGWDGKVNGKYVPPGTYFYIIEATGSDGIEYLKKGHVNILSSK